MTDLSLPDRERALVAHLTRLIGDRSRIDASAAAELKVRTEAADRAIAEARQKVEAHFGAAHTTADQEHEQARTAALNRYETERSTVAREYAAIKDNATTRVEQASFAAGKEHDEARWTLTTLFEAKEKDVKGPLEQVQTLAASGMQRLQAVREQADALLVRWRQQGLRNLPGVPSKYDRHSGEPAQNLKVCVSDAEGMLGDLRALQLPGLFTGYRAVVVPLILAAAIFGVCPLVAVDGLIAGKYHWLLVAPIATVVFSALSVGGLYWRARVYVATIYRPLRAALGDGEATAQRYVHVATRSYQQRLAELAEDKKRLAKDLKDAEDKFLRAISDSRLREKRELHEADQKYPARLAALEQRRDTELAQAEEKHRRTTADLDQRRAATARKGEDLHRQHIETARKQLAAAVAAAAKAWRDGLAAALREDAGIRQTCAALFPSWSDPSWQEWTPASTPPPMIPFGEYRVELSHLVEDAPLPEGTPATLTLPALLSFPRRCSLLFKARDAGRAVAVRTLQALMLRFLTALPPGKARFSIIDPVGLGENFSAFMHLADYDEALVSRRIWTEAAQIEQVLADVAAHMENVLQKYLRNQYASIEEYNAQAGEVAEPFRVLVVANFPANFTADAARRLVSIAASGASCGVFVLVAVDSRLPLPHGFTLADLEQSCLCLLWKDERFVARDPDWARFPLKLEEPPDADAVTKLLHQIGTQARDANRVEVPFDFIAPAEPDYWTGDSRGGISVPLGRSGATKRQSLMLGKGTSQHVLVAGKTGSGKSTLLHALITNLSLIYSPAEVELYLIDFKKGVEFKAYAAHNLPHARVIAIESEREFGLSVLQRLDAELRERGDRFRANSVQNLADYRSATGKPCPRIMLIVDEFQEFFVEDDKTAQEAALLLDRLVRQGRAFGLHVLLGSQTLGGAYTLARSTIDQMAVRIALQCSEADAQLILSKDNAAARLLSRPGEAIYNNANGLLEGNDIFQTVWLADERREELLDKVAVLAVERHLMPETPPLIFEGNIPADPSHNVRLAQLLHEPVWPTTVRASAAWLGEAMAIKDPTAAIFRRQASSNLLLIGQREEAALAVLYAGLVALAAQHAPPDGGPGTRFFVLDGSAPDSPHAGSWTQLADVVPHPVQVAGWRELAAVVADLAAEVDRRVQANDTEGPTLYLFVSGLQRFRELRRSEDDFGFGRRDADQPVPPAKRLETILREGPTVGVHALVWCDTLNNVNRAFDRQALRDFEMRVLFPMSANDSSTLIDSPAASKLNVNHALYCTEDRNQPEKFRPFGLPAPAWLAEVKQLLRAKAVAGETAAGV